MLALLGAFDPAAGLSRPYYLVLMALAGVGVVLTTAYFVMVVRRVAQGSSFQRLEATRCCCATPPPTSWPPGRRSSLLVVARAVAGLAAQATDPVVRRAAGQAR